jgi:glycosyltransferase involved in cell wall biosynthesis
VRVLQLATGERLYGAERWVLALVRHLDPAAVTTTVACLRDGSVERLPLVEEARRLGLPAIVLDARRGLAAGVRALRALLGRGEVDVLHTHGVREDVAALLARRRPVRLLATPHGWETRCSLKERARAALDRLALLGFDAVAPLSRELHAAVRRLPLPRSRVHLIENGVDLGEVDAARPVEGPLPGQGGPGDLVVGYVGRLVPGKGLEVLLAALRRLPPAGWVALIVGEGPGRERLEHETRRLGLEGRVTFLGYRPDRLAYLKRFDRFVLPSWREGTPRCLMEALAAGVPCAGSAIPGIAAVLQDGVTGDTFPPGDAGRLAAILADQRRDPGPARRRAAAGRALVRERFSAGAMARAYEGLYRRLATGQQGGGPDQDDRRGEP